MLPMVGNADEARANPQFDEVHPAGKRGVALQVAHDRYRPARSPTSSPPPTSARPSSARSRPPRASRTPTPSPRSTASTACGSAISTCRSRSAFPASSTIRTSRTRSTRSSRPPRSTTRRSAAWCRPSSRASRSIGQGFDFICYSGDVWVLHNALAEAVGQAARRLQQGRGDRWPTDKFRVALSGDFRKPDGSPTYPDFDLGPLRERARRRDGVPRIAQSAARRAARGLRRADPARPSLRRARACRRAAGSPWSPASASATTPSTSRPAPTPASPSSSRPTACAARSPSRSSPSCWR